MLQNSGLQELHGLWYVMRFLNMLEESWHIFWVLTRLRDTWEPRTGRVQVPPHSTRMSSSASSSRSAEYASAPCAYAQHPVWAHSLRHAFT